MKILKRGDYGFIILITFILLNVMLVKSFVEVKPIDTNIFTSKTFKQLEGGDNNVKK